MVSTIRVDNIQNTNGTTGLTIDSSGFVFPKVPVLEVGISTTQVLSNATWTKVAFDTVDHDNAGWYDNSAYRYTPQKAGYYQVNLTLVHGDGGQTLKRIIGTINTSGSNYGNHRLWDEDWNNVGGNGSYESQTRSGSRMFYMNGSTDFIEGWAWANLNSGSPNIAVSGEMTRMTVFFVST